MKKIKKVISFVLVAAMIFSLVACGNGKDAGSSDKAGDKATEAGDKTPEKHTIAVACTSYTTELLATKAYLEEYVADALNIEFIFSEELGNDPGILVNFVETAYSAGAEAIVDYSTANSEAVKVLADKCEELGIYLATWLSPVGDSYDGYEYVLGAVGKNPEDLYDQFKELIMNTLDDGETHNVVVCTINAKMGVEEHIQSSCGVLAALQEMYDLTFEDELENLAKLDAVTEISTGRDDVKITIFPTFSADDMNEVMKSGEYDTVVILGAIYLRFESTIAEIEKAYNKDVKVIAMTSVSDQTLNSYQTKDVTGDSSLNGTLLVNLSRYTLLTVMAINAVNGDADAVMEDGKPTDYYSPMWICNNAEEYEVINQLDRDDDTWVYTIDELKQMIKFYNPDVNPDTIREWAEKASLESAKERRGIQ